MVVLTYIPSISVGEFPFLITLSNIFTFICIYFLLRLFLGHQFLFLQFLLGYLFLLYNLLFWFRSNVLLQLAPQCGRERSHVGGSDHESVSPAPPPGGFVHLNVLNDQRTYI